MKSLRDYIKEKKENLVTRSNSCIPQTICNNPFEYASTILKTRPASYDEPVKITVIDPYINALDLDHLTFLFGCRSETSLEIISKYNSTNTESKEKETSQALAKDDRKEKINDRADELVAQGLFRTIHLKHSKTSMHDRYYIFWNEETIEEAFQIGGSVAQKFSDYISINEIQDKFMLSNIETYYHKLISNTKDFK